MKTIKIYNTLAIVGEDYKPVQNPYYYEGSINNAIQKNNCNLSDYISREYDNISSERVPSIQLGVKKFWGDLYGEAICSVVDDWTDKETELLVDYLCGQYSDGWGESF